MNLLVKNYLTFLYFIILESRRPCSKTLLTGYVRPTLLSISVTSKNLAFALYRGTGKKNVGRKTDVMVIYVRFIAPRLAISEFRNKTHVRRSYTVRTRTRRAREILVVVVDLSVCPRRCCTVVSCFTKNGFHVETYGLCPRRSAAVVPSRCATLNFHDFEWFTLTRPGRDIFCVRRPHATCWTNEKHGLLDNNNTRHAAAPINKKSSHVLLFWRTTTFKITFFLSINTGRTSRIVSVFVDGGWGEGKKSSSKCLLRGLGLYSLPLGSPCLIRPWCSACSKF